MAIFEECGDIMCWPFKLIISYVFFFQRLRKKQFLTQVLHFVFRNKFLVFGYTIRIFGNVFRSYIFYIKTRSIFRAIRGRGNIEEPLRATGIATGDCRICGVHCQNLGDRFA